MSASPDYGGDEEWSGEPVIQVSKDGAIFIAGTCCIVASSPVWYSTDGKRFQELDTPGHVREWSIGTEGDLAIDDDGRIYFVDTYVPGLVLTRWSPGEAGPTWDYTMPANLGVPPGFNDRPWLAWSKKALYLYINHMTHTAVYRSTDGGLTWMGGAPLSWEGATLTRAFWPGHIGADRKTGRVYASGLVGNGTLGSAASEDGANFTTSVITKAPEHRAFSPFFNGATTVDEAGNVYVTWSMADQATTPKESRTCEVYYASSTDNGKTWSDPIRVSRGSGCATYPWITAGAKGKVALTWYQTPTELPTEQPSATLTNAPLWTRYGVGVELSPQDEVPPGTEWFVHAAAVVNATSKNPVVVEGRVPTKTPIALGPLGRQLWDFLQVAIGPKGDIHIAFAEKYKDDEPQTWYVKARGPKLR